MSELDREQLRDRPVTTPEQGRQYTPEGVTPARSGWSRPLPLVIVLIATLVLAILVRGFVETVIVAPILYLGWYLSLLLRSVPEAVFWVLFILLALILATRSLQLRRSGWRRRRAQDEANRGPLGKRAHLFELARTSPYFRWQLARELNSLAWELVWPGQTFDLDRQRAWLAAADSGMPRDVTAYFLASLDPYRPVAVPWFRRRPHPVQSPLDLDPDVVVSFLETLEPGGGGP